jgi:hypothetical protein
LLSAPAANHALETLTAVAVVVLPSSGIEPLNHVRIELDVTSFELVPMIWLDDFSLE